MFFFLLCYESMKISIKRDLDDEGKNVLICQY